MKENKDMSYVKEDIAEMQRRMKENKETLSKALREKEIADADAKRKARNAERLARFEAIQKEDLATMKFYKLSLGDVDTKVKAHAYDPSKEDEEYMRKAKEKTEELDDTPKWPSGMEIVKREGLSILTDLAEITESSREAGLLKKTAER
jgi:carboxyl-terminal processing protease